MCEPDPCVRTALCLRKMRHNMDELFAFSAKSLMFIAEVRNSHHDRQSGLLQRGLDEANRNLQVLADDLDKANRKLQKQTANLECLRREDARHVCDRSQNLRRPLRWSVAL